MLKMTEFTVSENVTATMTFHLESGEGFDGPLSIGTYPSSPGEVWIEIDGSRRNIPAEDIDVFCKQLKRAARIATEKPAA